MATLNINEHVMPGKNAVPAASLPPLASQDVAIGGTSAQSAALQAGTTVIRLATDTACWVAVGADPTAASGSTYMPAGTVEYFNVTPGQSYKVAVIQA